MAIKGLSAHLARVRAITSPQGQANISKALFAAADEVKAHAQHLITAGSVSGKAHKPSAPGTPPHNDSGILKSRIESYQPRPMMAEIRSEAPYAAIHEFGGLIMHPGGTPYFMRDGKPVFVSNEGQGAFHHLPVTKPHPIDMPQRPYMAPAREAKRARIKELVEQAINATIRSAGK